MRKSLFPLAAILLAVVLVSILQFSGDSTGPEANPPATAVEEPSQAAPIAGKVTLPQQAQEPVAGGRTPEMEGKGGSLRDAISRARHSVVEISDTHSAMELNHGAVYFASQPNNAYTVRFLEDSGIRLNSGIPGEDWSGLLKLSGSEGTAPRKADDNRVEFPHSPQLLEWYENRPEGLEHGFVVFDPGADMSPSDGLQVSLVLAGLKAVPDPEDPGTLFFMTEDSAPMLAYTELKTWDATGRLLRSGMRITDQGFVLDIEDCDAVYPVTIDPLIVSTSFKERLLPYPDSGNLAGDQFGYSVHIDGDTAIVGARLDDTPAGIDAGSAYVFYRSGGTWTQQGHLLAPDGAENDYFGTCVSVSGEAIVVGAPYHDTPIEDAGAVYLFLRSAGSWSAFQKILPSSSGTGDHFGYSVDISGLTVVVGDVDQSTPVGYATGSAYVFEWGGSSFVEQQRIYASDGESYDDFGSSVAVSGDTVVVTAPGDNYGYLTDAGSAYVFARSGGVWTQQQKLTDGSATSYDFFGTSASIDGETLIIGGAYSDFGGYGNAGGAFVYYRAGSTWYPQVILRSSAPLSSGYFGKSVSLSGNYAAITSGNDGSGLSKGKCEVFYRSGSTWYFQQSMTTGSNNSYGNAVSLSGASLIVGASSDDPDGETDAGAAFVYFYSGGVWSQQQNLQPTMESFYGDYFGIDASISGDTAAIGAWADDSPAGADMGSVYVFTLAGDKTWDLQKKLWPSPEQAGIRFGSSVAVEGDTLAVGAAYESSAAGAVYVFRRSDGVWSQEARMFASDGSGGDQLGYSIALSGDSLVAGAPFDDLPGLGGAGSARVFHFDGSYWSEQGQLVAVDAAASDKFGVKVAMSGDLVAVGVPFDDYTSGVDEGSVYPYIRSEGTWYSLAKIEPSDPYSGNMFGYSVDMSGDNLLVGCPKAFNGSGFATGAAYVFSWDGLAWNQYQKLEAADGASNDQFGSDVSICGDVAVVGAWFDDTAAGNDSGSAYVFARNGGSWAQQSQVFGSDADAGEGFGVVVANSSEMVLAGTYGDSSTRATFCGSMDSFQVLQLQLSNTTLGENLPYVWSGNVVGNMTVGGTSGGWSFSLVDGEGSEDNSLFFVYYNSLNTHQKCDHETKAFYNVRLRAYSSSLTLERAFVITVIDDRNEDFDGDGLTEAEEEDIYGSLDTKQDTDDDGILDPIEAIAGLDPTVDNSALLTAIQGNPQAFGVDVNAMNVGDLLLQRDPGTGDFLLSIELQNSTDLIQFNPMPIPEGNVTITPEGVIELRFEAPAGVGFYRVDVN